MVTIAPPQKPTILHLGDDIRWNHDTLARLLTNFTVIQPTAAERERPQFMQALRERRWGDFHAILRPFWNTGGEMGTWDRELVPLLPSTVRIFASAGAGYDWADIPVLTEHGILYCNGATASSEAVADTAIFHLLSTFRHFTASHLAARSLSTDAWLHAHKYLTLSSWNPRGHTLGVIGLGSIGYCIAEKAFKGFGMKIVYNDVVRKSEIEEKRVGATFFEELDEMLGVADAVVLATPFFGRVLLDEERFSKFKAGARFINIARGPLVSEPALIAALQSQHLSAAGLDVHAHEPHVNPALAAMTNVTLTCHNAGGAMDTWLGFERLAMENIERYLLGEKPITPVNWDALQKRSVAAVRMESGGNAVVGGVESAAVAGVGGVEKVLNGVNGAGGNGITAE
ncbi:putative D-mandelate dehydrogenase [Aulographum hederae CBS 113979]|uniref:Putative D-mandelate dehydrogenase n=1 Tax=Aulographum hederae CBS 113979 TaxID=1176131 RepID=A0A6G1GQR0_9PEZI|nr:putative D-mandelate dehydrogenase [Aulographum hederae CBS 113979]